MVLGGWVLSVERLCTQHTSERPLPRDPAGHPVFSYSVTDGERRLSGVGSPRHTVRDLQWGRLFLCRFLHGVGS